MEKDLDILNSYATKATQRVMRGAIMLGRKSLESIFIGHGLRYLGCIPLEADHRSFARFQQWISQGCHGSMKYLENHSQFRLDPSRLEPGLKLALMMGLPYKSSYQSTKTKIAKYAIMDDYHKFMKRRAALVVEDLQKLIPETPDVRITIDSAPLLERSLASKTEQGFIGKNTCYIHPKYGSFLLLGEILITTSSLATDMPQKLDPTVRAPQGGCGTCKRCQVHCPTGALDEQYRLDARLCLAYWTIEHRGTIPIEFWKHMDKYWYGCDICQDVCPYNRKLEDQTDSLPLRPLLREISLAEVATMDQDYYERVFGGTPLTRAKKHGLQRNALISLAVSKSPKLPSVIRALKEERDHPSVIVETLKQVDMWMRSSEAQ